MPTNVALTGLARDLSARAHTGKPVRIGLVGAGEMGTDIVSRVAHMQGIAVGAISEVRPGAAERSVQIAYGTDDRSRKVTSVDAANAAMEAGLVAVTEDVNVLLNAGLIDVVVDATGIPAVGAKVGLAAMQAGKHLVMMNVEADVTIGAYLRAEAEKLGVVYSLGAGDEPSSCMELIEFVSAMGHRIISAGKGKNNPLNVDATPDLYADEARRRNMNPRMLVEFVDGSKTMVEMAAIANATGLLPDKPGMHGPACSREELNKVLVPQSAGGVLSSSEGCVDFSIGKGVAPGVFVVAEMEHPRIRERMEDLKMGQGPYFTFFRPYHLTSLEVPLTCARAVLYGKADMVPLSRPVAEVCAVAKRDLLPGETLDQIGEYCYRAWIMTATDARLANAVPCGLLAGARTTAPVRKGELLTSLNTAVPADSPIAILRARQDAMLESLQ
ncbi:Predicted homoserine dehydrogenase, contains C-terminal SAF domain [Rhizobium sp. RU35A]|uniref:NAD(P)H-dependent oxidoreductase n=1 Tax=Rhizobium sp. RU35A TaxID=1907414 RepID=UPI000954C3CF|nr:NAD(P)H-dependent oxidoreductase [Rhizobium sp. RU35A]SIQ47008.1 Predicted homoserine dehydrogenase, contains C-terminal SAF domain [Rhizobium sp. RU35A]